MRILQVVTSLGIGGAEQVAFSIAKKLARQHASTVFAVMATPAEYATLRSAHLRQLDHCGVDWHECSAKSSSEALWRSSLTLARKIRTWQPDVVHSHTDIPDACTSIARRLQRFRIVRTIHNTKLWPTRPSIGRLTESGFVNDTIVAIGPDSRRAYLELRERSQMPPSAHLSIVENGIDLSISGRDTRENLRRELNCRPEKFQLGFVGRLTEQKGIDVLLKAIHILPPAERTRVELHVIGDGDLRSATQAFIDDTGLPVRLHGAKPEAKRYFSAFDLAVVPSRYEGAPLAALEVLASGTRGLFTDAPGLRDVLPPDCAPLAKAGDAASLAAELARCIQGGTHPHVPIADEWLQRFSADRMAADYERIYVDALRRR